MSSKFVLVSRFKLSSQTGREVVADLNFTDRVRYYFDREEGELLQLRAYDDISGFSGDEYELNADKVLRVFRCRRDINCAEKHVRFLPVLVRTTEESGVETTL